MRSSGHRSNALGGPSVVSREQSIPAFRAYQGRSGR